jgi:hypothetical protein
MSFIFIYFFKNAISSSFSSFVRGEYLEFNVCSNAEAIRWTDSSIFEVDAASRPSVVRSSVVSEAIIPIGWLLCYTAAINLEEGC